MNKDLERLRERMSALSDQELLRIVNVEYRDYRPEALEYAKAELDSRGVAYGRSTPAAESLAVELRDEIDTGIGPERDDEEAESDQEDLAEFKPSFCIVCGAETRCGYLFGGRGEMTAVFSDNNEERFVQLDACPKCGHVRLIVDFETDVAS
jgi:hypothetical protein